MKALSRLVETVSLSDVRPLHHFSSSLPFPVLHGVATNVATFFATNVATIIESLQLLLQQIFYIKNCCNKSCNDSIIVATRHFYVKKVLQQSVLHRKTVATKHFYINKRCNICYSKGF